MLNILSANCETAYGVNEYVIDTPEEIASLPRHCDMGSIAIVISTSEIYMKNGQGEWVKL